MNYDVCETLRMKINNNYESLTSKQKHYYDIIFTFIKGDVTRGTLSLVAVTVGNGSEHDTDFNSTLLR